MSDLRIEELSASNVVAANNLSMRPGQEDFVAPVSHSIAESFVSQDTSWPRVIVKGSAVVAFILANFDDGTDSDLYRSAILRMNVDAEYQRQGIGSFAVGAVLDEARNRGFESVTAVWEEGDLGPGRFFRALGFEAVGETEYGEVISKRAVNVDGLTA